MSYEPIKMQGVVGLHNLFVCTDCSAVRCPECKRTDGPYPPGTRPSSAAPIVSGCPSCGYCV